MEDFRKDLSAIAFAKRKYNTAWRALRRLCRKRSCPVSGLQSSPAYTTYQICRERYREELFLHIDSVSNFQGYLEKEILSLWLPKWKNPYVSNTQGLLLGGSQPPNSPPDRLSLLEEKQPLVQLEVVEPVGNDSPRIIMIPQVEPEDELSLDKDVENLAFNVLAEMHNPVAGYAPSDEQELPQYVVVQPGSRALLIPENQESVPDIFDDLDDLISMFVIIFLIMALIPLWWSVSQKGGFLNYLAQASATSLLLLPALALRPGRYSRSDPRTRFQVRAAFRVGLMILVFLLTVTVKSLRGDIDVSLAQIAATTGISTAIIAGLVPKRTRWASMFELTFLSIFEMVVGFIFNVIPLGYSIFRFLLRRGLVPDWLLGIVRRF